MILTPKLKKSDKKQLIIYNTIGLCSWLVGTVL